MRVIGFSFKKISIKKNKEIGKEINIDTDIQIKDIQKKTTDLLKNQDILNIDYEFKISYLPDFADILFNGNVAILMEKDDEELMKKIIKNWKSKKVEDDLKLPLLNIIFARCNLKAMELEEAVNLPFHIPTPQFSKKQ